MKYSYLSILFLLIVSCKNKEVPENKTEYLTDYVNTFIGTDGPGNTYPGATVPYGMVQLSPDIGIPGWDRIAGYFYQDSIISGFSHMHLTGTGAGDLYDILVMPVNSRFSDSISENNFKPYSRFSHEREKSAPGYYTVDLLDYGIKAELTATEHTGIHRYTFPEDPDSRIMVDLGYALNWDRPTRTFLKVVNNTTIEGFRMSTGWARDQRVYFVIKTSKPFNSYKLFNNDTEVTAEAEGVNTRIELNFETDDNESIVLKTGVSSADINGAHRSLEIEAPDFDFDKYRAQAHDMWEKELQKITIESDDLNDKSVFYTMMYQSMLAPTLLSDLNGNYKGANDSVMKAVGYKRYDTFSLWDTFRAAHPLYTIIQQERIPDFIRSMLAHYQETGLLPVWSMQGNETNMMIGYHAVPVIVDAYFKGFDFDHELAYEACKASAMTDGRQIDEYKRSGYVPAGSENEDWSVSKTVEYAYDDWCIAMFAKALGKADDHEYFLKRSESWKQLYDRESAFLRPKDKDGKFISPFIPKEYTKYFCESNAWQYFFFVPQNVEGLMHEMGGSDRFSQRLDSMFSYYPTPDDKLPIFSTGMIGQYAHGNEPSHHVAYLYAYTEEPEKSQKMVREILKTQYKNQPDGHCGNEDCGQMSSWYIFSALGFYPVNPAQGVYIFGAPYFKSASIQLSGGRKFEVKASDLSDENIYVKAIKLNGKELKRCFITHKEIMEGGTLEFEMVASPVKDPEYKELPEVNKIY